MKALLFAATATLSATAANAEIVVWNGTTGDFILSGRGNPVKLISLDVLSQQGGTLTLSRASGVDVQTLGVLTPGQKQSFTPNIFLKNDPAPNRADYGFFYFHLNVDSVPGFHLLATFTNVTLDIGDNIAPLPEPSTWALMIGGFALAGTAARTRRPRPALT